MVDRTKTHDDHAGMLQTKGNSNNCTCRSPGLPSSCLDACFGLVLLLGLLELLLGLLELLLGLLELLLDLLGLFAAAVFQLQQLLLQVCGQVFCPPARSGPHLAVVLPQPDPAGCRGAFPCFCHRICRTHLFAVLAGASFSRAVFCSGSSCTSRQTQSLQYLLINLKKNY